ncbi:uncharacterized protein LOC121259568 [Juglans microcarpa x Juglans regia]|uniref:uncharacterized protein LOC121259568 n=1 Tax=Juglans microcarpa x Juglans regia TaxID=2249226 RepID=UPI001B7E696C|nr:uncharacterized protein LOC121259568 [Juglans microcarpa x Juglans regia]
MEMEVVDFNFDSSCSSPYKTALSSPQQFDNFYFSAPTSPTCASSFYRKLNNLSLHDVIPRNSSSSIPFDWASNNNNDGGEDFEFDFSGHLKRTSFFVDKLYDGRKIKPIKPPPQLQVVTRANDHSMSVSSPRSPRSRISQGKMMVQETLSPRHKKDLDPFTIQ